MNGDRTHTYMAPTALLSLSKTSGEKTDHDSR